MKHHLRPSYKAALLLAFLCSRAFADNSDNQTSILDFNSIGEEAPVVESVSYLTVSPSATLWGFVGSKTVLKGQALWPFGGDGIESIFYGAVEAAGSFQSDSDYSGGLGAGYRKIIQNSYILGGYLLADYDRSVSKHNFAVINPGIEALGYVWDFRVNAYLPVGDKYWYGGEKWASEIGIYNFERFSGHSLYDHKFQWYEEAGMGGDAEIGRNIPIHIPLPFITGMKAYVGGYYFSLPKTDSITGAEARLVFPMHYHTSLEVRGSYDNVRHGTIEAGLRLSFGNSNNLAEESLGIASRLSDPIEHNFANFKSGTSVPVNSKFIDENKEFLISDHIWFFRNTYANTLEDGTYEYPYAEINQAIYNNIANSPAGTDAMLFFAGPGTFDLSGFTNSRMGLLSGYAVKGRTTDFREPAALSNRPLFIGGFDAASGNNLIELIQMQNNNDGVVANNTAIRIINANNVELKDVLINSDDVNNYRIGIDVQNSQNINIAGSTINARGIAGSGMGEVSGVRIQSSAINLNGNNIISSLSSGSTESYGVELNGGAMLNLYGANTISANALNGNQGFGISNTLNGNSDQINIFDGRNTITGSATVGDGYGIYLEHSGLINIIGGYNTISGASNWGTGGGIFSNGQLNLLGYGNVISGNSVSNEAVGIKTLNGAFNIVGANVIQANSTYSVASGLSFTNSTGNIGNSNILMANSTNNIAYGIYANNANVTVGNSNLIQAVTVNNQSNGIYYKNSTILLGSSNSIFATATSGNAYGLNGIGDAFISGGTLTINGVGNTVFANSSSGTATGIYNNGNTVINGISNRVLANSTSGVATGIYNKQGTIYLRASGSDALNTGVTISATSTSNKAIGIELAQSNSYLEVDGNWNTISANVLGSLNANDTSYGILDDIGSQILFAGNNNKVLASSTGNAAIGLGFLGAGTENLTLNGFSNTILGQTISSSTADAFGISKNNNGSLVISGVGSSNNIEGISTNANGYGLYNPNGATTISAAGNNFFGESLSTNSLTRAVGIYYYGSSGTVFGLANNNITGISVNGEADGIIVDGPGSVTLHGNNVVSAISLSSGNANGILLNNTGGLTITGVGNSITASTSAGTAIGINANNNNNHSAKITIDNLASGTLINATSVLGNANGVYLGISGDELDVFGSGTRITANASGSGIASGITAQNGTTVLIQGVGNKISANQYGTVARNGGGGEAYAIFAQGATITISNGAGNILSAFSNGGSATALYAVSSHVLVEDTNIIADSNGSNAYGVQIFLPNSTLTLNRNTFKIGQLNGTSSGSAHGVMANNLSADNVSILANNFQISAASATNAWGIMGSGTGWNNTTYLNGLKSNNTWGGNVPDNQKVPGV